MSELDEFLAVVLPRQNEVETALHRGDSAPRKAFWSEREPVSVLGAARSAFNRAELVALFDWLGSRFSRGDPANFEVITAGVSNDLGYVVGYEHTKTSIEGAPPAAYHLRVTLIFRREDGEWRAVHRHADPLTEGQRPVEQLRRR